MISPAPLIVLSTAADENLDLTENVASGISLLALMMLVTAAVVQFISCGLKNKPYQYIRSGRIDTACGVDDMVYAAMQRTESQYQRQFITGVALCILGIYPMFIDMILWGTQSYRVTTGRVCPFMNFEIWHTLSI